MGLSVYVRTYIAVEASLSSFFTDTGERTAICTRYECHEVSETAKFCEHCGAAVGQKATMKPTEAFAAFCEKAGATPESAFEQLKDGDWEWSNDEGESHPVGWYAVNPVEDSESRGERLMALGVRLVNHNLDGWVREARVDELSYTASDLTKLSRIVLELMSELRIDGTPKLYVQGYMSY